METEYQQQQYFDFIHQAIQLNKQNRERFASYRVTMSPVQWAFEYCTVRISLGRGLGNTSYVSQHLDNPRAVIITYHPNRRYFQPDSQVNALLLTITKYMDRGNLIRMFEGKDKHRELILIDNCNKFTGDRLIELYEFLVNGELNQTFVLLG